MTIPVTARIATPIRTRFKIFKSFYEILLLRSQKSIIKSLNKFNYNTFRSVFNGTLAREFF